jgi:hypothetical protein
VTPVGLRFSKDKQDFDSGDDIYENENHNNDNNNHHNTKDDGMEKSTPPSDKGKNMGHAIALRGSELSNVNVQDHRTDVKHHSPSNGGFSNPTLEIKLRTSEQDPSPHQVMIPSAQDLLFPAHLCEAFEKYREIDQNFDFGSLVGMSRGQMVNILSMIKSSSPNRNVPASEQTRKASPPLRRKSSPQRVSGAQKLIEVHVPIIDFFVRSDDLVLVGFFHEICDHTKRKSFDTSNEMSTRDRMEVAIMKSDAKRQFFVVYQGCSDTQAKPIKKGEHKDGIDRRFTLGRKDDDHRFSEEQPVVVFPPFRKAYFNSEIEEKVFHTLDSLAEQYPFFDVIMTGHSFGGAMAHLSSMRYANARPAIMVSCFDFGCPKIGNTDFLYYVNSLPNLRVST